MAQDDDKLAKIANSTLLLFTSRISAPIIVALCCWLLTTVLAQNTMLATSLERINGHETRIVTMEKYWDDFFFSVHNAGVRATPQRGN